MWVKKHLICKKEYVCNPSTCTCENGKCLANIMNDSAITYDEIIYTEEKNFNEKDITCKRQNFYLLLAFLLITITFIDSCKYILLSHKISNKTFITISRYKNLKQIYIENINWKWVITLKI